MAAIDGERTTLIVAATCIAIIAPTIPRRAPPMSATNSTATDDMSTMLRITRGAIR
jgi:hypothetical protein